MILFKKQCKIIGFILAILFSGEMAAQKVDSLILVLKAAPEDTNKVNLLISITGLYAYSEPVKGKLYAEQLLNLSQKLNYKKGTGTGYYFVGLINSLTGKQEEAEVNYNKALNVYTEIKNIKGQGSVLGQFASLYFEKEQFDKALEYRFKALKLFEGKDKKSEALTLTNIAIIYSKLRRTEDAEKNFNKALAIKNEIGDSRGESIIYTNLGALFFDQKKYDEALLNFKKALDIQKAFDDTRIILVCKINIANILSEKKQYGEALSLYDECYTMYKNALDTTGMVTVLISIGNNYQNSEDYKTAVAKYEQALPLLKSIRNTEQYRRTYMNLCQCYIELKDAEKANVYLGKLLDLSKAIFDNDLSANIAQLKEKYESEKREQDILLLTEQNSKVNAETKQQKFWIISVCFFSIALLLLLFLIIAFNRNRKKQKELEFVKIKAELEQTALRAQMNPHFIFNALNSIQHYILSKETEYAYDYLAKFSKLIRQVLVNSEHNTIALDKEMETLKLYIELEQRRFKNRFDYELIYSNDLPADDIHIPTLLVQPFVENAIWHGIMNLDEKQKGKLIVSFNLEGKILLISIEDNGVGRKEAALRKVDNEYASVGVLFTQKRIDLLQQVTKQKATIRIIDLENAEEKSVGTKVEITIELPA